ncbi:putative secreted protein precursor; FAD-dependent pyridine nucleotide-disulphide oxidoreductase domain; putative monooxygenase (ArsO-like) [Pseudorhizobium banfieldiae]|uniref:Putative secreted protein FAD-dependent pyridine nucleotide-disulphide oxidoreductase domain putative monooxygenase (ArsO-like) n=1 Tax=Pseudorhizobium banfieldiae TaxID=1125847 RepID=L0NHL7_9HYPH|nr:NAD(P)-binding domain-containing protein [Pseudorhizobium banfieldiae]CAD6615866.1 flavoprotein [arsenite-oxidising bacterium NT-25]CCF20359.1 putative secreted protein precursor; FAD-dependent pyridine nucleotide-disulphide oxidoreductase domain; putative monooxygenase (ArsO-like) [Pseudorhizobium banfieldiae]
MKSTDTLPIAVLGAGPVGMAAAARVIEAGLTPLIFERGSSVGTSLLEWGHVRVFSPWKYNIDDASRRLLDAAGWTAPAADDLPTGREIVEEYLVPMSRVPAIARALQLGATVTAVARVGLDKVSSTRRTDTPFLIRYRDKNGEQEVTVRAVIDASGTWLRPNPMGVNGLPVLGEGDCDRISYGIPDVAGERRSEFLGKRTLVVGSGHSAINVAIALLELRETDPSTVIYWALRRHGVERLLGGGLNDQLPERGALGVKAKDAMEAGHLRMLTSFSATKVTTTDDRIVVAAIAEGSPVELDLDQIVVATGFRPDVSFLREVRIELDPAVEAPPALAPLIDPNLHSCGTVPPHGVDELTHPEKDFYIVGSKSYGRAPTFLMKTGYEQVRSVVAELAGDAVAARRIELVLPETGVCSVSPSPSTSSTSTGCCGGPAPSAVDACCVADAEAKAEGRSGCGCGSAMVEVERA